MNKQKKIVIIGAGAAGIACATKLLDCGFQNVLVVEAESRLGGRIQTIPFADNVIDLGAQWCHGEQDNIVHELASKHNLLESTGPVYDNHQCVRSNQEVLSEHVASRLKAIVNDSLVTRQIELRNFSGSLGGYLTNKFYGMLHRPEYADIDVTVAKEFFENYKKFENSVEASDTLDQVSGRGYLEYWECEGDILLNWKDKGYVELLRLLLRSRELQSDLGLLEQRLIFNRTVTQINWIRNDTCVELLFSNDETCIADHVVITVSLGVLKEQHSSLFEPRLPLEKQRAIDGLAYGTVNKIFLEFPHAFWPDDWTGFTLLWRDEDLQDIRNTKLAWLEDVFGFYRVSYQPRILAGWITNTNGRYMETLHRNDVIAGLMYLFRRFLRWHIPEPLNFQTSAWYTNKHFRGSYSYRSMETEKLGTGACDLAQPLTVVSMTPSPTTSNEPSNGNLNADHSLTQSVYKKPIVLFAGEASSVHYYSTVHGAVESGWREAKRLVDFYSIDRGVIKSQQ